MIWLITIGLSRPRLELYARIEAKFEAEKRNMLQGNQKAYSVLGPGVLVETWPYNTIRRNSIFSNGGGGISLVDGGNQMLPNTAVGATVPNGLGCTGGESSSSSKLKLMRGTR
jgi:parallel beta-helix repeat protein